MDKCIHIYLYAGTFAHLISKSSILRFVYIGICGDVLSVVFPREYIPSGNSQLFQTRVFNVNDLPYIYIYVYPYLECIYLVKVRICHG